MHTEVDVTVASSTGSPPVAGIGMTASKSATIAWIDVMKRSNSRSTNASDRLMRELRVTNRPSIGLPLTWVDSGKFTSSNCSPIVTSNQSTFISSVETRKLV